MIEHEGLVKGQAADKVRLRALIQQSKLTTRKKAGCRRNKLKQRRLPSKSSILSGIIIIIVIILYLPSDFFRVAYAANISEHLPTQP